MTLKLPRPTRTAVATAVGVALIGGAVVAQTVPMEPIQWDKRRLDTLDRNVRRLERAVMQRNAAGQPVLVEPDPEVTTLQARSDSMDRRLADVEDTLRRVNGDVERLTFGLDEAQRDNAALRGRLVDADRRIKAMEDAAKAEAELNGPIVANSPTGGAPTDIAAAVRLLETDPARGERALQTVIATWPDTNQAREANSRLGDLYVSRDQRADAVRVYAAALQGWPTINWAGETTLKLADALIATDRKTQACAALSEYQRRYAQGATAPQRTRATQLRGRAGCPAN